MNESRDIVETEEQSYDCKVSTVLTLTQCCIVMDEVGGDLNMLSDGHKGGTKYVTRT